MFGAPLPLRRGVPTVKLPEQGRQRQRAGPLGVAKVQRDHRLAMRNSAPASYGAKQFPLPAHAPCGVVCRLPRAGSPPSDTSGLSTDDAALSERASTRTMSRERRQPGGAVARASCQAVPERQHVAPADASCRSPVRVKPWRVLVSGRSSAAGRGERSTSRRRRRRGRMACAPAGGVVGSRTCFTDSRGDRVIPRDYPGAAT